MADKRIEYIGPFRPGIAMTGPDGQLLEVAYGEPFDVPADFAAGLLRQSDNWRETKPGPKPKAGGDE